MRKARLLLRCHLRAHREAHHRLGFAPETVSQWLEAAGLDVTLQKTIAPEGEGRIAVSLWLARDPRLVIAGHKEVA